MMLKRNDTAARWKPRTQTDQQAIMPESARWRDDMRVYIDSPDGDLEGLVDDDQDLDGTFVLTDDDGEKWTVNGWTVSLTIEGE